MQLEPQRALYCFHHRIVIPGPVVAAAIDVEGRGRIGGAVLSGLDVGVYAIANALAVEVTLEPVAGEPQRLGSLQQPRPVEPVLVFEQVVVHGPERALQRRRLGGLGRESGVGVQFVETRSASGCRGARRACAGCLHGRDGSSGTGSRRTRAASRWRRVARRCGHAADRPAAAASRRSPPWVEHRLAVDGRYGRRLNVGCVPGHPGPPGRLIGRARATGPDAASEPLLNADRELAPRVPVAVSLGGECLRRSGASGQAKPSRLRCARSTDSRG